MKKSLLILLLFSFIFSCDSVKKDAPIEKKAEIKEEVAANYKSIEVDIEGMTCEIGCARTIQSKLSKFPGVTFSKVSFESKKGQFTFDTNKVSQEDIVNKISGIAGGDSYSVINTKTIEETTMK
jgi:mercuric ion binding protein